MDRLTILLILSLILPALCYKPADFGFTDNGDGTYSKVFSNGNGRGSFTVNMNIDGRGRAYYRILGDIYGNGIGTIMGNKYMVGSTGYPLTGWEVPGANYYSSPPQGLASAPTSWGGNVDTSGQMGGGNLGTYTVDQNKRSKGNYFSVDTRRSRKNGQCSDTIRIQGIQTVPTSVILDEFHPECKDNAIRAVYVFGEELLVGSVEQNFCVYGHIDIPDRLIVIQDGNCVMKTYSRISALNSVDSFDQDSCKTIKELVKNVQNVLENPALARNGEGGTSQQQLNQMVKGFTTSGGDQTTAGSVSSANAAAPTPSKSQHGFFKRLWIAIKNFFRKLAGRPTKDE